MLGTRQDFERSSQILICKTLSITSSASPTRLCNLPSLYALLLSFWMSKLPLCMLMAFEKALHKLQLYSLNVLIRSTFRKSTRFLVQLVVNERRTQENVIRRINVTSVVLLSANLKNLKLNSNMISSWRMLSLLYFRWCQNYLHYLQLNYCPHLCCYNNVLTVVLFLFLQMSVDPGTIISN